MARITPFSVGQRWYVDRGPGQSARKPNFWFVILGPGDSATEKLCLLEIDRSAFERSPLDLAELDRRHPTLLSTYSHTHIKKVSVLTAQTPDDFAQSQARCEGMAARIRPLRDAELAGGLDYTVRHRYHRIMEAMLRDETLSADDQTVLDGVIASARAAETPALQAAFDGPSPTRKRQP